MRDWKHGLKSRPYDSIDVGQFGAPVVYLGLKNAAEMQQPVVKTPKTTTSVVNRKPRLTWANIYFR